MIGDVTIATPHGEMPSYLAAPSRPAPWPGVVVIHDFTGMSHDLRNQADWLASEGFLAAAPDLYYWGSRLRCLRTIMRDIGARRGRTFDDIDAARTWLTGQEACTIVGSYGGQDGSPLGRRAAVRLERALTALQVPHDVKVYPYAGHGFMNDHDPADQTFLLVALAKLSGTRYHEPSAADARRRIVSFFERHLA